MFILFMQLLFILISHLPARDPLTCLTPGFARTILLIPHNNFLQVIQHFLTAGHFHLIQQLHLIFTPPVLNVAEGRYLTASFPHLLPVLLIL